MLKSKGSSRRARLASNSRPTRANENEPSWKSDQLDVDSPAYNQDEQKHNFGIALIMAATTPELLECFVRDTE